RQRLEWLSRIGPMIDRHRAAVAEALAADFDGHSPEMAEVAELMGPVNRAAYASSHVREWMKPSPREVDRVTLGRSRAYARLEPKGVIGNIVPWNFPFDIGLGPTIDALAAGNRVVVKPSELAPACGQVLADMVADTFAEDEVAVVTGDLELSQRFASLPWDHLVFTGSARVGREVMRAAAANLVPVTLELGGKCPVVVDADKAADPETIANVARIKLIKHGQMCVSADYCLVPREALEAFTEHVVAYWREHFPDGGAAGSCGIINDGHLHRLAGLVADAEARGARVVQIGPDLEPGSRRMPLCVVVDPPADCAVMDEEIFGPILPILPYEGLDEVIAQVERGGHPLALYVFSDDADFVAEVTRRCRSGGVGINTVAGHAVLPSLGFGGVGASGMGRHHGHDGFREFSNPRGYFALGSRSLLPAMTPPYGPQTRALLDVAHGSTWQQLRFGLPRLLRNQLPERLPIPRH
ncbi:MAG TPA: aldehyde dehydrogenase family protein, partial [Candidatus Nanopelagicales bacterium]